ncbi:hypothetical protein JCM11641_003605 [Rhodosporidiobolus odoratus]
MSRRETLPHLELTSSLTLTSPLTANTLVFAALQKLKPTALDSQLVTVQSSLQQVKTLLDAGIGCITYLRGLFPEEAFDEQKLLAPRPPLSRTSTKDKSDAKVMDETPLSVRVKKLKRGMSSEVDKLMDWLDKGATEAIKKGYLHQLIFAIYLDPDDATNVVETYTFTFNYETDAQGNKRPELVVQNQLSDMVISSTSSGSSEDRPRQVGDIKRQVQVMIKNLITSTQLLDELPRRRYLTVRLFYTDETPPEYEPPCFKPVQDDMPGYTLATPGVDDPPDFATLGSMFTGFHGVALHSVSIAHLLDTAYDEKITLDEALQRNQDDAVSRPVVWNAESLAGSVTDVDARVVSPEPIFIKNAQGDFVPLGTVKKGRGDDMDVLRKRVGMEVDEDALIIARGELEETLIDSNLPDNENLRRAITALEQRPPRGEGELPTQPDPVVSRQRSYRPPVPFFDETNEQYAARAQSQGQAGESSKAGPSQLAQVVEEDETMELASPPAETQLLEYSQLADDHPSFRDSTDPEPDTIKSTVPSDVKDRHGAPGLAVAGTKKIAPVAQSTPGRPSRSHTKNRSRVALEEACECGDKEDDGAMIACGTCGVWKHVVCYGYHSLEDARLPEDFVCYPCRVVEELEGSLIDPTREDEIQQALADLRTLALFRRSLTVVSHEGILPVKQLAERLGVDNATAGQVLKRLQVEGFIYEQAPVSRRLKGKGNSQVGSIKKGPLVVDKTPKQRKKKAEYFNPGRGHESSYSMKLALTDVDAEVEPDSSHKAAEPFHQQGSSSPSKRQAALAAKRSAALLVEETPSPALPHHVDGSSPSSQAQQAPQASPPSRFSAMDEDDPILAYSPSQQQNTLPSSTPQETITTEKSESATAAAPKKPKSQELPRSSYDPSVDKGKGKAKAVEQKKNESFRTAASKEQAPLAAGPSVNKHEEQIKQSSSAATPSAASSSARGKRPRSDDAQIGSSSSVVSSVRPKRKRCSDGEGGAIEV